MLVRALRQLWLKPGMWGHVITSGKAGFLCLVYKAGTLIISVKCEYLWEYLLRTGSFQVSIGAGLFDRYTFYGCLGPHLSLTPQSSLGHLETLTR